MDQEKLMKQIQPGALHVMVVGRQDGTVGFLYARDPLNWLAQLGTHVQLGEVEVRVSAAAERIVNYLRTRFRIANVPSSPHPWYLVDFDQARRALDEVNLETGEPADGLEMGSEVMVLPQRVRGWIFGFTHAGQIVVRHQAPRGVKHISIVPRENLKPIVRIKAQSDDTPAKRAELRAAIRSMVRPGGARADGGEA